MAQTCAPRELKALQPKEANHPFDNRYKKLISEAKTYNIIH